jgi:hypothetical protein
MANLWLFWISSAGGYFPSLDIPSIPQIITRTKSKAMTEESKLAEAARDVQKNVEIALGQNQLKFPLEPPGLTRCKLNVSSLGRTPCVIGKPMIVGAKCIACV